MLTTTPAGAVPRITGCVVVTFCIAAVSTLTTVFIVVELAAVTAEPVAAVVAVEPTAVAVVLVWAETVAVGAGLTRALVVAGELAELAEAEVVVAREPVVFASSPAR